MFDILKNIINFNVWLIVIFMSISAIYPIKKNNKKSNDSKLLRQKNEQTKNKILLILFLRLVLFIKS